MANNEYVVTHTWNGHKLSSTLYGEITPERIEKAKKELAHRAEQLMPSKDGFKKPYTNERSTSYRSKNNAGDWGDWNEDEFDEDDE